MKEQLYEDFKNLVLPKVAEGLTMTKEYFFEFFGRYVKYLIVTDTLGIVLSVTGLCFGIWLTYKGFKCKAKAEDEGLYFVAATFVFMLCGIGLVVKTGDLIKAIYVPEVRIYESIKMMK